MPRRLFALYIALLAVDPDATVIRVRLDFGLAAAACRLGNTDRIVRDSPSVGRSPVLDSRLLWHDAHSILNLLGVPAFVWAPAPGKSRMGGMPVTAGRSSVEPPRSIPRRCKRERLPDCRRRRRWSANERIAATRIDRRIWRCVKQPSRRHTTRPTPYVAGRHT